MRTKGFTGADVMARTTADHLWCCIALAGALILALGDVAHATTTVLTIDGRDVANLAGDGNHPTFHNPPVNFAFTFGGVTADNPDAGPGDPPTASERDFHFTGNNFGGLGFGTAAAGDFSFITPLGQFRMDVTVNPGNTLGSLTLNLKDADAPAHLIEEWQYTLPLGAPGTKTLAAVLVAPVAVINTRDGIVNFDPGNGLIEIQLQYPLAAGGTGAILDVTVHEMRIIEVPEPGMGLLLGVAAFALPATRRPRSLRRR